MSESDYEDGPIHAHLPWESPDAPSESAGSRTGTCRYCGVDIPANQVVCGDCREVYIQLRKKALRQTRRLCEIAAELKNITRESDGPRRRGA